uniref:Uncharacterized protein n=1 Tax=Graphocephala atropunctata TaxID=36148 RepID=A0A1B6LEW2_9HEMI
MIIYLLCFFVIFGEHYCCDDCQEDFNKNFKILEEHTSNFISLDKRTSTRQRVEIPGLLQYLQQEVWNVKKEIHDLERNSDILSSNTEELARLRSELKYLEDILRKL